MTAAVFIGPEGGFDLSEVELLKAAGARTVSLGKRILRTETAGLVALSWLMLRVELSSAVEKV
jgi:16S rRNA (uracil1498-N3)-methyltransferase